MRFFGDRERVADGPGEAQALVEEVEGIARTRPGPARHEAVAGALVRAGALAQGIADAEATATGLDEVGPGHAAALAVLGGLGRALWRSWLGGGAAPPPDAGAARSLAASPLPPVVRLREPEGFAFYGAYPEPWAVAGARVSRERAPGAGPIAVLGLRSIGTTLAAVAAAGARAGDPVATLRPSGHPFQRRVAPGPRLAGRLEALAGQGATFLVADEGPGLSGSSFAAAAEALQAAGAPPSRIILLPGHGGSPGPFADERVARVFASCPRRVATFEEVFQPAPEPGSSQPGPLALPRLFAAVLGAPAEEAPPRLLDVSNGAWREHASPARAPRPPSQGWRERRKFLVTAGGRTWLARFAGLGARGRAALLRARALADAGLGLAPAGIVHGLLLLPWLPCPEAVPVTAVPASPAMRRALRHAAVRHACFVAAHFAAREGDGASPAALLAMARENAGEALGAAAGPGLAAAARYLPDVVATSRPVAVDGKADAWEWLAWREGFLKADALDHGADHALPGAQDALWDVAGAELALGWTPREGARAAEVVRRAAPGSPPALLPFYRVCRAAFEVGRWTLAAGDGGIAAEERALRERERDRAVARLRSALAQAEGWGSVRGRDPGPGSRQPPGP